MNMKKIFKAILIMMVGINVCTLGAVNFDLKKNIEWSDSLETVLYDDALYGTFDNNSRYDFGAKIEYAVTSNIYYFAKAAYLDDAALNINQSFNFSAGYGLCIKNYEKGTEYFVSKLEIGFLSRGDQHNYLVSMIDYYENKYFGYQATCDIIKSLSDDLTEIAAEIKTFLVLDVFRPGASIHFNQANGAAYYTIALDCGITL